MKKPTNETVNRVFTRSQTCTLTSASAGVLEYTNYISEEEVRPKTNVRYIILNHLMMRLQYERWLVKNNQYV